MQNAPDVIEAMTKRKIFVYGKRLVWTIYKLKISEFY